MDEIKTSPVPLAEPARRLPIGGVRAERPLSLPTRAMRAALVPVRVVLMPLGYFFRIREPLPIAYRLGFPIAFFAIVIGLWYGATKGEFYLGRFEKHSPLDRRKIEIEKAVGAKVELETRDREIKSWASGEVKVRSEVAAVIAPRAAFEAHRAAVESLFGKDFKVEEGAKPDLVRLVPLAHFGVFDRDGEWAKARAKLEHAIPGAKIESEDRLESPGTEKELAVVIVTAVRAPKEALEAPLARAALDAVFGRGSYEVRSGQGGEAVVLGREIIETRKISPALLPSPREMLDSLPSLVNRRWSTWQDAVAWWKLGEPETAAAGAPPRATAIEWSKPTEAPFQLLDLAFARMLGPNWTDWKLFHALLWSTVRIIMGFLFAAVVAVPLGIVMGSFTKPRVFFDPLLLMGAYLPLPAFLALTIIWWGTGEAQKIGFLAICTFVVLLPQVVMAVEGVPKAHLDAAQTLGATRWQQMRHVLVAGAKADIMRALRLSFAVGWTWIILAEYINAKAGLGYLIDLGQRRTEYRPHVYAVIVVIVLVAFVVNTIWAWIERKVFPYREAA
jgi:NitT/TauT family transport system permease protein